MDALLIKPGRYPERIQIDNEFKKLQEVVEGNIEVTYPWADEVGIICNEEGKFNGQTFNRALFDQDGQMYGIIVGPFLVGGLTEDDFGSLRAEQMEKYEEMFHQPEMFVKMGRGVVPIRLEEEQVKEVTEKAVKDISKTVAPKTVQQFLGHASLQMTMDLYTHVLPSKQQDDMLKLQAVLDDVLSHQTN